jgi:hypothetical protein
MWKKYSRAEQVTDDNMVHAQCIPRVTYTQSEHVILIVFTRQQWLRERATILNLCVFCLSF